MFLAMLQWFTLAEEEEDAAIYDEDIEIVEEEELEIAEECKSPFAWDRPFFHLLTVCLSLTLSRYCHVLADTDAYVEVSNNTILG
jgi:hypothetical protein